MTCQDPLLTGSEISDWTTLDYALSPPHLREVFRFEGAQFQQLINSRHLPLVFHSKPVSFLAPLRKLPLSATTPNSAPFIAN